ncbi:unnamed protein product, partial [Mesorhabditis spiculigera]
MLSHVIFLLLLLHAGDMVQVIDNGLAPPEIVHRAVSSKPLCRITAAPLDLLFVLDSSGSLRDQFQDEIEVIRKIVRHVAIGENATRVALIQFSGVQHLEFNFHSFATRDSLMAALSVLRHVSGITRVGGAFKFAQETLEDPTIGIRDWSVPKVLFLLSDGRTHDFPMDFEIVEDLRRSHPRLEIWAYGTGEYVAMTALLNYTRNADKIVTNSNLDKLEDMFAPWHGIEICETQPACVKGSDKPLDLFLIIDSSESVDRLFQKQVQFAIDRIINNINLHPEAVRMALITFSGKAFTHFAFNDTKFWNNSAVVSHLNALRSIKGTTSTHLALDQALRILKSEESGARSDIPKLAIVLTDGRSHKTPAEEAKLLREAGCPIIAVAVMSSLVEEKELVAITGDPKLAFTTKNLEKFEEVLMEFVGFGCPGIALGPDATPTVRGATDVKCDANGMEIRIRTVRPMQGMIYAQSHHEDRRCIIRGDGKDRELALRIEENTCGMTKWETLAGYVYNVSVILQFHPLIQTRADQGIDLSCLSPQPLASNFREKRLEKKLDEVACTYNLHRYSPEMCAVLEAKVGETIFHKWQCELPSNHTFLVHDCYVRSEHEEQQIIDEDGCALDVYFLETPIYDLLFKPTLSGGTYIWQEMSAFKFPGDPTVEFSCQVSLCEIDAECSLSIPPKCGMSPQRQPGKRLKRQTTLPTRHGFASTFEVSTHAITVLENEGIRPRTSVKFCDIY